MLVTPLLIPVAREAYDITTLLTLRYATRPEQEQHNGVPPKNLFSFLLPFQNLIRHFMPNSLHIDHSCHYYLGGLPRGRGFAPVRASSLRSLIPQLVAGLGMLLVPLVTIRPRRIADIILGR